MVTERDGGDAQAQEVKLATLDALVLDVLKPRPGAATGCLRARRKLEQGDVDGAIAVLQELCPKLMQEGQYRFKLIKQKFVELCNTGADSRAIACAREELAPLALNTYPEAYAEFKTCLQLLVYTKDVQRQQQEQLKDIYTRSSRWDLASSVYHAAAQMLNLQEPTLVRILAYLLRLYQAHRTVMPCGQLAEQALVDQLLLPRKDAGPLPSLTGPTSFREADIQALIHCAGSSRREAMEAIKHTNGDVQRAFCAEISRVNLDKALLRDLLAEYVSYRGLGPDVPSSDSRTSPSWADDLSSDSMDSRLIVQELVHPTALYHTSRIDSTAGPARPGWPLVAATDSRLLTDEQCPSTVPAGQQVLSVRQHLHVLRPERSISQSPPAKVPRCQGANGQAASVSTSVCRSGSRLQELLQRMNDLAKDTNIQGIINLVNELDGSFLESHPEMLFDLKRCEFLLLLEASATAQALSLARSELAPLAAKHEALQPTLKATMALLLDTDQRQPSAAALLNAVAALQASLREQLGMSAPMLIKLLQLLLGAHQAWLRREKFSDPFQGALKLDSLRASPTVCPGRSTISAGAGAVPHGLDISGMPNPNLVQMLSDEDDVVLDEDRILRLMEVLEISRSSAFDLLMHHDGDVEAAIMSSLA